MNYISKDEERSIQGFDKTLFKVAGVLAVVAAIVIGINSKSLGAGVLCGAGALVGAILGRKWA